MPTWLFQPVRLIGSALAAHDSSRQLAWGAALGMLLGLVPKGNLTALLLAWLLFSSRANLGMGLVSACAFSWIGMLLDPLAHRLGWRILSYQPLQPTFAWCHDLPLVPWSDLNNTVVIGQLVLGLYLLYPVYWFSRQSADRWRYPMVERIRQYRVVRLMLGVAAGPPMELGESTAAGSNRERSSTVLPRTSGPEPRNIY